ncbi:hypothetical protein PtA15_4A33 [Puccinia triticina]|uniref:Secreted protein n=1 Tax=Puccinia triticina TaxID=208348 RepID=A0ABY7CIF0_9BASI|nr:uncharacterized protein PtA15_4A33 [Puccinia triticina]WAQ83585.1 hypothetical protein PtA15_4A33 [Puccinia triticina]
MFSALLTHLPLSLATAGLLTQDRTARIILMRLPLRLRTAWHSSHSQDRNPEASSVEATDKNTSPKRPKSKQTREDNLDSRRNHDKMPS